MTYQTIPAPPPIPRAGGRPRLWEDIATAIRESGEWVVVPPEGRSTTNESLMVTLRKVYFPDHKLKSRNDKAGNLYVKLGQPKETAR